MRADGRRVISIVPACREVMQLGHRGIAMPVSRIYPQTTDYKHDTEVKPFSAWWNILELWVYFFCRLRDKIRCVVIRRRCFMQSMVQRPMSLCWLWALSAGVSACGVLPMLD